MNKANCYQNLKIGDEVFGNVLNPVVGHPIDYQGKVIYIGKDFVLLGSNWEGYTKSCLKDRWVGAANIPNNVIKFCEYKYILYVTPKICALTRIIKNTNTIWYVYIIQCSDKNKSYYTGITNDINKRIETHNQGRGAKFTKGRGPVTLVASFKCENKSAASKLELKIKKMSRQEKEHIISSEEKNL